MNNYSQNIEIFNNISAPINKGQKVGELTFSLDDKVIARVDLVSAKDVDKYSLGTMMKKVYKSWFTILRK